LDLGDLSGVPGDIDDLCERVERMAKIATLTFKPNIELSETKESCVTDEEKEKLYANGIHENILANLYGPVFRFSECDFQVEYPDGSFISTDGSVRILLKPIYKLKHQMIMNIKWYNDNEGMSVTPTESCNIFAPERNQCFEYTIKADGAVSGQKRFVIEVSVHGRQTVMLMPIILLGR
jgi:hypothetical protein